MGREKQQMEKKCLLKEWKSAFHRKLITEGLEHFVMSAHTNGAISAREAESILHPLHHQISSCLRTIHDLGDGVIARASDGAAGHHKEGIQSWEDRICSVTPQASSSCASSILPGEIPYKSPVQLQIP